MAAGGINAVLSGHEAGDSVEAHIEDTLKGGGNLAGKNAVTGLCEDAENIIHYLESIGTIFSKDETGRFSRRGVGGASFKRTCYSGSATGKQIVSALVMEVRRLEAAGLIERRLGSFFHSALIQDGVCFGALFCDSISGELTAEYADALVMATGGQNVLFGKTTGSTLCDGYAAGKLFLQGAELKNLEFIQYHPTTLETLQKKILISEAVRGEGGRLFYLENGKRVYFMEEKYGTKGNLGKEVFLDVSFLKKQVINEKIPEVRDLCRKYRNIDIVKHPIPVTPSVHFFMGGLAVHNSHETNIQNLYAIGECASIYHGANRLGGNSLLAAIHGAWIAANEIVSKTSLGKAPDFTAYLEDEKRELLHFAEAESSFPPVYIKDMVAKVMNQELGIVRSEEMLKQGISDIDYYLSVSDKIRYDSSIRLYDIYSLQGILTLGKAVLTSAKVRQESRGAHYREDYPETNPEYGFASIISYSQGAYRVRFDKEQEYEN